MQESEIEELKEHLEFLRTCCLEHPQDYDSSDVSEIIAFEEAPRDGHGGALYITKNGMYGVLNEWRDYTGHGCRCSSSVEFYANKDHAIRLGFTREMRKELLGIEE